MFEQAMRKANEANAPHRARIVETKRRLRGQITDMPERFAAVTANVEAQIDRIERERAQGISPVPQLEFDELDRVDDARKDHIRQRGCLVIRNVFDDARVNAWNADLSNYLEVNDYLEKLKTSGAVDNYFSTLASAKPQIYGVYWSRAQMEARTDPAMARARRFLNGLWRFAGPEGDICDPRHDYVYADRVRFREPGDSSLGLSPHVDAGSIERWIDPAYSGKVYRHVFGGDLAAYRPFDAWGRTEIQEIPSPAVCRMFRTFQGWTALTEQGAGDGTLQLLPVANAMVWMLLRALQDDVPEDDLCGAAPGRALGVKPEWHADMMAGTVSIPEVMPGDTVWWHTDICHSVADEHAGKEYASVIYIGSAPDCAKNRAYLPRQKEAFLAGKSPPDFAQMNFEVDFNGRATEKDLTELGRRQMGF